MELNADKIKQLALEVLDIEADAIQKLRSQIDQKFVAGVSLFNRMSRTHYFNRHRQIRSYRKQNQLHFVQHW